MLLGDVPPSLVFMKSARLAGLELCCGYEDELCQSPYVYPFWRPATMCEVLATMLLVPPAVDSLELPHQLDASPANRSVVPVWASHHPNSIPAAVGEQPLCQKYSGTSSYDEISCHCDREDDSADTCGPPAAGATAGPSMYVGTGSPVCQVPAVGNAGVCEASLGGGSVSVAPDPRDSPPGHGVDDSPVRPRWALTPAMASGVLASTGDASTSTRPSPDSRPSDSIRRSSRASSERRGRLNVLRLFLRRQRLRRRLRWLSTYGFSTIGPFLPTSLASMQVWNARSCTKAAFFLIRLPDFRPSCVAHLRGNPCSGTAREGPEPVYSAVKRGQEQFSATPTRSGCLGRMEGLREWGKAIAYRFGFTDG